MCSFPYAEIGDRKIAQQHVGSIHYRERVDFKAMQRIEAV